MSQDIYLPKPSPNPSNTRAIINAFKECAKNGTKNVEADHKITASVRIVFPPYFLAPLPPITCKWTIGKVKFYKYIINYMYDWYFCARVSSHYYVSPLLQTLMTRHMYAMYENCHNEN